MRNVLLHLCAALALASLPLAGCGSGDSADAVSISDDFDDERIDPAKWGPDEADCELCDSEFVEQDGVIELLGSGGYVDHPWIATLFPYDSDWEVHVDVENTVDPFSGGEFGQYPSIGLSVFNHSDRGDRVRYDLYTDSRRHYRGYYLDAREDGGTEAVSDTHELAGLTTGALRVRFDSIAKQLAFSHDVDSTDGYQWTEFRVVDVRNEGPADIGLQWNMVSGTDWFSVSVHAIGNDLESGMLRADHFRTIGGFRP